MQIKAPNSTASASNSIAKVMKLIAKVANSTAKVMNSITNGTKSIAKVINLIAKTCKITQHSAFFTCELEYHFFTLEALISSYSYEFHHHSYGVVMSGDHDV